MLVVQLTLSTKGQVVCHFLTCFSHLFLFIYFFQPFYTLSSRLTGVAAKSSATQGGFNQNSLLLCISFEAILFPLVLPAEMLSCDATRYRPGRSFSWWQSDDPTQRFSGTSIKQTLPVSAAAHLCSFIAIEWVSLMKRQQWLHLLHSCCC